MKINAVQPLVRGDGCCTEESQCLTYSEPLQREEPLGSPTHYHSTPRTPVSPLSPTSSAG